jgi:galactokinase
VTHRWGTLDRCVEAAGFEAQDVRGRAALLQRAIDGYTLAAGRPPTWVWHVPGRIEIFGKHTDYAGGESLLATVPRGFAVVAGPRDDQHVRVIDARHHEEVLVSLDAREPPLRGWANYVAVTARRLRVNFPDHAWGADIAIVSDLPRAAGVSSSSALVVGIATALMRRSGVQAHDAWRRSIGSVDDLAWYLGCVENGLTYRDLPGTTGVGTQGGSQDHTAILGCRPGKVSHFGFMPVQRLADIAMPTDWRFIVMSSGVHADKAGSVRERYNRASLAVRALVRLWQEHSGATTSSLTEALRSTPDAEARLRASVQRASVEGFSPADLDRRLTALVQELERIPRAASAFAQQDAGTLRQVTRASQRDAEQLLGNQIPETVVLAQLATETGAFAASAFGAGFGGSVWALAPSVEAEQVAKRWRTAYEQKCHPTGHVEHFTCRPGPPVVEILNES